MTQRLPRDTRRVLPVDVRSRVATQKTAKALSYRRKYRVAKEVVKMACAPAGAPWPYDASTQRQPSTQGPSPTPHRLRRFFRVPILSQIVWMILLAGW